MVNEIDVFDSLQHITDISEANRQNTVELCRKCFEALKRELRSGADTEDERVIQAAAARVYYMLCLKEKNAIRDNIESFKAGDLSVSMRDDDIDGRLAAAEKLCEKTAKQLIPLLEDTGFYAGKVDI